MAVDQNAMVECQEGIAKSNKKSVASKGASIEDAKVPAKAQEDSDAKKGPGLCKHLFKFFRFTIPQFYSFYCCV